MATGEILSQVGGVAGLVALLGAAVGYGRLQSKITTLERDVAKLSDLGDKVSRIDERTKNTDDNVKDLKTSVQDLTNALLNGRPYGSSPARSRS